MSKIEWTRQRFYGSDMRLNKVELIRLLYLLRKLGIAKEEPIYFSVVQT